MSLVIVRENSVFSFRRECFVQVRCAEQSAHTQNECDCLQIVNVHHHHCVHLVDSTFVYPIAIFLLAVYFYVRTKHYFHACVNKYKKNIYCIQFGACKR